MKPHDAVKGQKIRVIKSFWSIPAGAEGYICCVWNVAFVVDWRNAEGIKWPDTISLPDQHILDSLEVVRLDNTKPIPITGEEKI